MTRRLLALVLAAAIPAFGATRFEISFTGAAHPQPVTGRVFVMISKTNAPEPRLQAGNWRQADIPFFAADIDQLRPGAAAIIDASTPGYPLKSLQNVPAGDYYVQGLVNVYTEFHRSDGHTIWAHMDQWEGQKFNRSPGNLYSEIQRVHLDPAAGYAVKLDLNKVIPPFAETADTDRVKRIRIQSKLLTAFWGHPFYIGATVLLPRDYDKHPTERYPVIYSQGHFGTAAPFGFTENSAGGVGRPIVAGAGISAGLSSLPQRPEEPPRKAAPATIGRPTAAADFSRQWMSDDFPRMIAVTWQHPTPFFDDSYAMNSANNGPFGDALFQELIPYLEEHFRLSRDPRDRVLTGGSTGGWESLALQIHHPDFFNGTWTFYPDPIDFHRWEAINIYDDPNAFEVPGYEFIPRERPMMRTPDGQTVETVRQKSQLEAVLGSRGRSGEQYMAWEAVYGPVGSDGYPKPLWDKATGKIDKDVATYMRDHGYDLDYYAKSNWTRLAPLLKGKLHLYCGDMDNYFLNLAVYLFEDSMKSLGSDATFEYGRPMKGHGWQPMSNAELVKMMAAHIAKSR